jgi:hypothetical protein
MILSFGMTSTPKGNIMPTFHTCDKVIVCVPPCNGHTHDREGQEGKITAVSNLHRTAQVRFPGMIRAETIPLAFLEPADVDLTRLIAKVARATNIPDTWQNPSKLESYPEYLKLVNARTKLTTMRT